MTMYCGRPNLSNSLSESKEANDSVEEDSDCRVEFDSVKTFNSSIEETEKIMVSLLEEIVVSKRKCR